MKRFVILACALLYFAFPPVAVASCTTQTIDRQNDYVVYTGSCTEDNEILIIANVTDFDACRLFSTVGTVDVFITLDGTNYTTAALSMSDDGATDTNPVIVTLAGRAYSFAARFKRIRVTENGATDAAASLFCFKYK